MITLQHRNGLKISLSPFGATWLSCLVPLRKPREILLGCTVADLANQSAYLGATIGRYANRIAGAQYTLNDKTYHLSANQDGKHTLHGGADNFAYRLWAVDSVSETHATFVIHSPDGDQGFNGNFCARVTYTLSENAITIEYEADCDQDSICALTNHAYFNLDGDDSGDARRQQLFIPASYYQPLDSDGIPNAALTAVADTPFDFRTPKLLTQDFNAVIEPLGGYDHDWYLDNTEPKRHAATLQSHDERVTLTLHTTQPALRVYSGNFLAGTPKRDHGEYANFAGIALETGCLANSPNNATFRRDCVIYAGKTYRHKTLYTFDWK